MNKTAPCYSKTNYYQYFEINFKNKKVLDIGSSIGSFKKSKKFIKSSNSLVYSKSYITLDIDPTSRADIISDAHDLPFKDGEFNIVIANNVIEHFYNPPKAVEEIRRVLKKGGTVFFTIPFMYPLHEKPHDYVRYTEFGLSKLFEKFNKVEIIPRGGVFSTTANFIYKTTHVFDPIKIGDILRVLLWPILWLFVQLDRFDNSGLFARSYFGKATK